jgi:beta-lactam-binding protein with PASTA domain
MHSRKSLTFLALAATCAAVVLPGCGSDRVVPDVKGQPADVAQRILADLGFNPTLKQVTAATPAGLVSSTEPVAGSSTSSDGITIRVSQGPALQVVPDTVNLEGDLAASALTESGFKVDQTTITSALVRAGTVVRSSPPAGRSAAPGSTIVLLVSGGAHTTAVPDLGGVPVAKAVKSLQLARLRQLVIPSPGIGAPGKVGAQSPSPGQVSAVGTTVRLWVNKPAERVKVPKLVGLTGGSASALLQNLGVEPRFVSRLARKINEIGTVLSQSPPANSHLTQGGYATLVVGTLPSKQQAQKPSLAESFGLLPKRTDVFSFVYDKASCPAGRGAAQIVSDLAIPFRKGSASIIHQGPVDLGDGRVAQVAVVTTNGDFLPGSAEVAIRIQPCPHS